MNYRKHDNRCFAHEPQGEWIWKHKNMIVQEMLAQDIPIVLLILCTCAYIHVWNVSNPSLILCAAKANSSYIPVDLVSASGLLFTNEVHCNIRIHTVYRIFSKYGKAYNCASLQQNYRIATFPLAHCFLTRKWQLNRYGARIWNVHTSWTLLLQNFHYTACTWTLELYINVFAEPLNNDRQFRTATVLV